MGVDYVNLRKNLIKLGFLMRYMNRFPFFPLVDRALTTTAKALVILRFCWAGWRAIGRPWGMWHRFLFRLLHAGHSFFQYIWRLYDTDRSKVRVFQEEHPFVVQKFSVITHLYRKCRIKMWDLTPSLDGIHGSSVNTFMQSRSKLVPENNTAGMCIPVCSFIPLLYPLHSQSNTLNIMGHLIISQDISFQLSISLGSAPRVLHLALTLLLAWQWISFSRQIIRLYA